MKKIVELGYIPTIIFVTQLPMKKKKNYDNKKIKKNLRPSSRYGIGCFGAAETAAHKYIAADAGCPVVSNTFPKLHAGSNAIGLR